MNSKNTKVAIIGAGLIGNKRARALPGDVSLEIVCDTNLELAKKFSEEFKCGFTANLDDILKNPQINAVIVSTPNSSLSPITEKCIAAGKHVLVEKPGGLNPEEIERVLKIHSKNPVVVVYGYNHRYHPSLQKAKSIVDSKEFGEVLFIRAKYGHGGRLGYEKEWRFKKELSGGGELMDQGSHLIDLTNFFIGETKEVKSSTKTFFWKTDLEDTAFMILGNHKNQSSHLSVSCVEWKNLFCFEIMLKTAKLQVDGLGGSYGREKLTIYKMKPEMVPPEVEEQVFEEIDQSWNRENQVFFDKIYGGDTSNQAILEARYVLDTIEAIYKQNEGGN